VDVGRSVYSAEGFAEHYERFRPRPPEALLELLTQLAGRRSRLVVDLGCGTGLSTRVWADRAESVVGVELNPAMLEVAEAATDAPNVSFRLASATETGLEDGCADLVTCSQALHWLPPDETFAEVARILRPGGVFAAYDCDWPPTVDPEVDACFEEALARASRVYAARSGLDELPPKGDHLARMRASGRFRYARETLVHGPDEGDAERLLGVLLSQGYVAWLLREGVGEAELGIDRVREAAARRLDGPRPWWWSYRVRLGIR
jgi:SAM-dependent methyltransferase